MKHFLIAFLFLINSCAPAYAQSTNRVIDASLIEGISAEKNLVINGGFERSNAGWSGYLDTAGVAPVDGSTTNTNLRPAKVQAAAIADQGLGSIVKDGTNRQGYGAKYDFSIPPFLQGSVLEISFDYIVNSGTFTPGNPSDKTSAGDSSLTVWVYDSSNSQLIQPSEYRLYSNAKGSYRGTFQVPSSSTSMRLLLHNGTTSTAAYTLYIDNVKVSSQIKTSGSISTDPVQYTPTFGAGYGSVTNQKIYWQRDGKFLRVFGSFTAGTTTAGTGEIGLPSGLSIDASYYQGTAKNIVGGFRQISNGGGAGAGATSDRLGFDGTTLDKVWLSSSSAQDVAGGTFAKTGVNSGVASSATVNLDFTVAIQGWSSNLQLSSDSGNSIQAFKTTNTTQTLTSGTTYAQITISGTVFDKGGMIGTNQINIQSPGVYQFEVEINNIPNTATGLTSCYFQIGSTPQEELGRIIGNAGSVQAYTLTTKLDLKAGDVVTFWAFQNTGTNRNISWQFSGHKLSNPQTIAASDLVAASYKSTAGGSIGTSYTLQSFATKLQDTTGSWNGNTFTAPIQGLFRITSNVRTPNLTLGATQSFDVAVYKNGSIYMLLNSVLGNGGTNNWYMSGGSIEVPLLAGETLQIYARASIATTQNTDANSNFVSIVKVGN